MIATIARKELTEILRDGRFLVAGGIVLILLLAALATGWKHYTDVLAQHTEAQHETRQQWLGQGERNPHSAAHYGIYAYKPVTRLSLLDTGVNPYTGVATWLEAHVQNEFEYRPAQDTTAVQRFGDLTAAVVLQVLVPLLIILLAFSSFAGERDQGTLRQLLSLGVDSRRLAAGKALGIAGALALVLAPAVLVGAAALWMASGDGVLTDGAARAALMALAYVVYFAIVLAVAIGVSALAASARSALVILLAFWAVNSLFAGRVMGDLSALAHPLPSAVEFTTAMQRDLNDQDAVSRYIAGMLEQLMREHEIDDLAELPVHMSGVSLQASEDHGNDVFDRHYGRLFDAFERQNRFERFGAVGAPLVAMSSLSMGLAGTDFRHHRHFTVEAENHRRLIQVMMNHDIMHNGVGVEGPYIAGPELWAEVPDFEYRMPGIGWVLRDQWTSMLALLAWMGFALAFSFVATSRIRA